MVNDAASMSQNSLPAQSDLTALKIRQRGAWSSGDYAVVGTTLQIVGEELCEALDLRSGRKVLDVAAGNGNVSLAAARRYCDVVATDYVPTLLDRAQERASAERLNIEFREADAEAGTSKMVKATRQAARMGRDRDKDSTRWIFIDLLISDSRGLFACRLSRAEQ